MKRLGQVLPRGTYAKLAQPDGWDFYTGRTVNYREAIGGKVVPSAPLGNVLCGPGLLHASRNPND